MKDKTNNLEVLARRSFCKAKFNRYDLTLISEKSQQSIFHATCSQCQTASLILISNEEKGLLGVGMITDLDREEVKKKLKTEAITADEIINVYTALKN